MVDACAQGSTFCCSAKERSKSDSVSCLSKPKLHSKFYGRAFAMQIACHSSISPEPRRGTNVHSKRAASTNHSETALRNLQPPLSAMEPVTECAGRREEAEGSRSERINRLFIRQIGSSQRRKWIRRGGPHPGARFVA